MHCARAARPRGFDSLPSGFRRGFDSLPSLDPDTYIYIYAHAREGKFKAKTGGSYGNEISEYCPFVKTKKKKKIIYFKIFK